VDLDLPQRGAVEGIEDAVQETAKIFFIEAGDELRDLFLRDGGCEINVPGGQTGEGFRVA
jgi:hypothetical protein